MKEEIILLEIDACSRLPYGFKATDGNTVYDVLLKQETVPSVSIDNYYGSCSGCDTLLSISQYDWGLPTDEKVEEYMTLCLHLVQRMKSLGNVLNE